MHKAMKGDFTFKTLEVVAERAIQFVDLVDVLFNSGYRPSYGSMQAKLGKKSRERAVKNVEKESRQRYYNLLYKLKRDGLVKQDSSRMLHITENGKKFLARLRDKQKNYPPITQYRAELSNRFIIVAFDIPEVERRKRNWLREVLRTIGLTMAQKSLWIGKVKLPKEFIDDLYRIKLVDYVEIFEITKTGSLKHVL